MFKRTTFKKLWSFAVSGFLAVVMIQVLSKVAIAANERVAKPDLLSSLAIFKILIYGSIAALTIATVCIIGVWLKEIKNGSVW